MPGFNLLSVKLTAEAQNELLQLYDIVIQSNVSIMKECKTLKMVWSNFFTGKRKPTKSYFKFEANEFVNNG